MSSKHRWLLAFAFVLIGVGGWLWMNRAPRMRSLPLDPARQPALAPLNFPPDNPHRSPLRPVRAFPHLRFDEPLFLSAPADGTNRIFVVEKKGRIRVLPNLDETKEAKIFMDLGARLETRTESGLLGLAFDPQFARNRRFFVFYTAANPLRIVLSSFTVRSDDPDLADPASERILFEEARENVTHHAGMIAFGPDGMLYVAVGDGALRAGNTAAQDLKTLSGKLLRIDPSQGDPYAVPNDNPFVGKGGGVRAEIWAYGLRNPWRFSFEPGTGRLWLGDVGEDTIEEINVVARGANLGWRSFEGVSPFNNDAGLAPAAVTFPILEYTHLIGGAIVGGYHYRGSALPSLRGAYIYGDHNTGRIWSLRAKDDKVLANDELTAVHRLSSFGEDAQGELYALSMDGTVYRFTETAALPMERPFPKLLSQTGLFRDTVGLETAPGVVEYVLNADAWTDGAEARHWMALPAGTKIGFHPDRAWDFPEGTAFAQHLEMRTTEGRRRLETRVLLHETSGWAGYTYKWNKAQSDAELLASVKEETLSVPHNVWSSKSRNHLYPGANDCLRCHNPAAGSVLGVQARQLNRVVRFPDGLENQLERWERAGFFDQPIGTSETLPSLADPHDKGQELGLRVRSYLDVNCSPCHRPDGPAMLGLDMRFATPLEQTNLVGTRPVHGSEKERARFFIVAPGDREASALYHRMRWKNARRMPPVSAGAIDPLNDTLIGYWIDSLRANR